MLISLLAIVARFKKNAVCNIRFVINLVISKLHLHGFHVVFWSFATAFAKI